MYTSTCCTNGDRSCAVTNFRFRKKIQFVVIGIEDRSLQRRYDTWIIIEQKQNPEKNLWNQWSPSYHHESPELAFSWHVIYGSSSRCKLVLADRGRRGSHLACIPPPPPRRPKILSLSYSFQKICPNRMLAPQSLLEGWHSLLRTILDPPPHTKGFQKARKQCIILLAL